MKDLLKDKRILTAGAVVLVLIVLVGGLFLFLGKGNKDQSGTGVEALPTQIPVPTITADSIGLSLKVGTPGKTIIATVSNTEGITDIEYELTYTAKGDIPRGTLGKIELTKNPARAEITLGTCSDVCHYDEDVSNIKIVLKVTKEDGKVYQSQATLASAEE